MFLSSHFINIFTCINYLYKCLPFFAQLLHSMSSDNNYCLQNQLCDPLMDLSRLRLRFISTIVHLVTVHFAHEILYICDKLLSQEMSCFHSLHNISSLIPMPTSVFVLFSPVLSVSLSLSLSLHLSLSLANHWQTTVMIHLWFISILNSRVEQSFCNITWNRPW